MAVGVNSRTSLRLELISLQSISAMDRFVIKRPTFSPQKSPNPKEEGNWKNDPSPTPAVAPARIS